MTATAGITVTSVGVGAERLAKPFSYDSLIRDSRPVYPGAFPAFTLGAWGTAGRSGG